MVKAAFKNIWKPGKGMVIKEQDKTYFPFNSFQKRIGTIGLQVSVLLLKQMTRIEQPSEVQFDKVRF